VIDAVRIVKLALNHGIAGELDGPSSYLMKSPHTQRPDSLAREATEEFIANYARQRGVPAKGKKAKKKKAKAK
jgi:myo-inositol-1-phosphate synthase